MKQLLTSHTIWKILSPLCRKEPMRTDFQKSRERTSEDLLLHKDNKSTGKRKKKRKKGLITFFKILEINKHLAIIQGAFIQEEIPESW